MRDGELHDEAEGVTPAPPDMDAPTDEVPPPLLEDDAVRQRDAEGVGGAVGGLEKAAEKV